MPSKLFFVVISIIVGASFREVLSVRLSISSLDEGKKAVIGEFRSMMEKELPHEYMKTDTYLLRFLTAREFNLKEATNYLRDNLAWRKIEKIDSILEEDWTQYERDFPYELSSVTKDGRPVLYYRFGGWDMNGLVTSGDVQKFTRYATAKMFEDADRKVRSTQKGDDVAQFDVLINMDGYSDQKHGCMQCLQLMREMMQMTEARYSGAADNLFIVNSPAEFDRIWPFLAAALQEDRNRESMKVLGGRGSWEPVVLRYIAKEELRTDLQ